MTTTETPRVWIGCLASYNAGRLIGEWVDATDIDEMNECRDRVAAQAVEAAKQAGEYPVYFGDPEEFFLADHEGFGFNIGEYPELGGSRAGWRADRGARGGGDYWIFGP
jgi:glutamine synthetase